VISMADWRLNEQNVSELFLYCISDAEKVILCCSRGMRHTNISWRVCLMIVTNTSFTAIASSQLDYHPVNNLFSLSRVEYEDKMIIHIRVFLNCYHIFKYIRTFVDVDMLPAKCRVYRLYILAAALNDVCIQQPAIPFCY
jgi:hypothetical protein